MPRPGVDIVITEPAPTGGGPIDTTQCMMLGVSGRGPTDRMMQIRSLREYERRFGLRVEGQVAHDSARAFFNERGSNLRFVRLAGSGLKAAEGELALAGNGNGNGGAGLRLTAASGGTWANQVTVGITAQSELAQGGAVRVTVTDGDVVERSTPIRTVADAVAWSQSSDFVRIDADAGDLDTTLEVTAAVPLAGGVNDDDVDSSDVEAALKLFTYGQGFAQVCYPGALDADVHGAILEHCVTNRRPALLDLDDTDVPTVAADAAAIHSLDGARYAAALAPRLVYPGPAPGTTVLMPYSAVQAGIIAAADRTSGNPNESAAGTLGQSVSASGYTLEFPDDVREQLNDLGVTLPLLTTDGRVRTYGSRTADVEDPNWRWFPNSRVILAISHECDQVSQEFVHRQIDAQRRLFTRLEVALGGVCTKWFNLGALYGDTAEEAFSVDAGPGVNTVDTIEAGEIHAVIRVHTAPPGEWVVIEISKTPLAQAV